MLLALRRSRHSWCVLLDIYACLQFDNLGQGLSCELSATHCRLQYLVRTHNHFHFLYYISLPHTYICVLFARILIFHLLSFCLNTGLHLVVICGHLI